MSCHTDLVIDVVLRGMPAAEVEDVVADFFAVGASEGPLLQEAAERRQPGSRSYHQDWRLCL